MGMSPLVVQLKAALKSAGQESGGTSDEVLDCAIRHVLHTARAPNVVTPVADDVLPAKPVHKPAVKKK